MKGKVSFYFNAPNVSKIRTRVENPSEDFTKKLRAAVTSVIVDVVNSNTYDIRAKLIKKFQEFGETMKDEKVAAQVASPLNAFFDVFASETPFAEEKEEAADEEKKDDSFDD